jgi:aspartate 1-decarboxylase
MSTTPLQRVMLRAKLHRATVTEADRPMMLTDAPMSEEQAREHELKVVLLGEGNRIQAIRTF